MPLRGDCWRIVALKVRQEILPCSNTNCTGFCPVNASIDLMHLSIRRRHEICDRVNPDEQSGLKRGEMH